MEYIKYMITIYSRQDSLEVWKRVKDFEQYEISNRGRLRRKGVREPYFYRSGQRLTKNGKPTYIRFTLVEKPFNGGRQKRALFLAHRLVAEHFIPKPESKTQINHKDGNHANNNVSNLEWVTGRENVQHAHDNKLMDQARGERIAGSKLTASKVQEMRELYSLGQHSTNELARKYGVVQGTIWKALKKRTWSHV